VDHAAWLDAAPYGEAACAREAAGIETLYGDPQTALDHLETAIMLLHLEDASEVYGAATRVGS
jgi:hypothetical protein